MVTELKRGTSQLEKGDYVGDLSTLGGLARERGGTLGVRQSKRKDLWYEKKENLEERSFSL